MMPPIRVPDLPPDQVGVWLSKHYSVPLEDLRSGFIFGLIRPDIAERYQIEAVRAEPGKIVVAMANPANVELIRELQEKLRMRIEVVVTTPQALDAARVAHRAEIERKQQEFLASLEKSLDEGDDTTRRLIESVRRSAPKKARATRSIHLAYSFCDKRQEEVTKLVAGPRVHICDGCIGDATGLFASQLKHPQLA
jgi:hypothetical protein